MSYNIAHSLNQSQNGALGGMPNQYDNRGYGQSVSGLGAGHTYGSGSLYQYVESKQLPTIYVPGQYPGGAPGTSYNMGGLAADSAYGAQQPYGAGYGGSSQQGRVLLSPGYYTQTAPSVGVLQSYQSYSPGSTLPSISGDTIQGKTYHGGLHPPSVASSSHSAPSSISGPPTVATDVSPFIREKSLNIDYSSLVSYTVSPSCKRRRREKSRMEDSSSTYPCKQCGKVFQKPYNLKSHMKTHSTEKPFKCSVCSKTFARSHDKKRHEFLHGGEKNFKCEGYLRDGVTKWGCGKKFARSDALSRHFRTETGWLCIKPFMDEAKESEREGLRPEQSGPTIHQLPDPSAQNPSSRDSYVDNSSFIRKLIQSR